MEFDLPNKPRSLQGFASAIKGMINQQQIADKLNPHQALEVWPEIAGEQIAAVCEAEAVRGKTLFVRAKSSAWANELTFYKPDLLEKLNQRLGAASSSNSKMIDDIHFSTGNRAGSSARPKTQKRPGKNSDIEVRDLSRVAPPAVPNLGDNGQARLKSLVVRTKSVLEWKRENGWVECSRCNALYEPEKELETDPARAKTRRGGRQRRSLDICPVCRTLMAR